jgi:hypothetical protein
VETGGRGREKATGRSGEPLCAAGADGCVGGAPLGNVLESCGDIGEGKWPPRGLELGTEEGAEGAA